MARLPSEAYADSSEKEPSGILVSLGGCIYLLSVLVATLCMLIVNAIVCLSVHSALKSLGSQSWVNDPTLAPFVYQLFFFVVPVLLTIIQWNLYDRLNRIFGRR